MLSLANKTAMVTGASSGLGRHFAGVLADAGAYVVLAARRLDKLEEVAGEIEKRGGKALPVEMDVTSEDSVTGAFGEIREALGRPCDVLVNNSGMSREGWYWDMDEKDWDAVIETNLTGVWRVAKHATRAMMQAGVPGSIINIASMNAYVSNRGIGGRSYETSKAAMVQFTRATAADWAPYGITANAICPGLFMTDANVEWNKTKPEVIEQMTSSTPMGRAGNPPELGGLIVYLASDASSYMTGASLVIDGGYTLW